MPNHCSNVITLTGEARQLRRFGDLLGPPGQPVDPSSGLPPRTVDFEVAVPELRRSDAGGYRGDIWCSEHWGTKWNADEHVDNTISPADASPPDARPQDNGKLTHRLYFSTASAAPAAWFTAVCEQAAGLDIDIEAQLIGFEQGNQIAWGMWWEPGEEVCTRTCLGEEALSFAEKHGLYVPEDEEEEEEEEDTPAQTRSPEHPPEGTTPRRGEGRQPCFNPQLLQRSC